MASINAGGGGLAVDMFTGDGVATDFYSLHIAVPNTNGGTLTVNGSLRKVGNSVVQIGGAGAGQGDEVALAYPSAPASGSLYITVQASFTTGVVTIKTSASSYPGADAGNVVVFQQTLASTDTNPAASMKIATPA